MVTNVIREKKKKEVIYLVLSMEMVLDFSIAMLEIRWANMPSKFWWEIISYLKFYEMP